MKRLRKNEPREKRSWKKLELKRRLLLVTIDLRRFLWIWGSRHRPRSVRRLVKKHLPLLKTTLYFKRYLIQITKMYPSSARLGLKLNLRLSARERNDFSTYLKEARSLSRSTTTAHTPVVGRRPRVRGLIYKTSSGGLSYARLSVRRKVLPLSYATSRKLSQEFLRTSQTINPFLKSLRRVRMRMRRLVRKCLVSPDSTRKTTPISDSQLSLPF